jgi:hypothetical protein
MVGNAIAIVFKGGWDGGQQPQASDHKVPKVIQRLDQFRKITNTVAIAVFESADVQLVDDCILVPERISGAAWLL